MAALVSLPKRRAVATKERRPTEASAALPESEIDPIVAIPIAAASMLTPSIMIASSPMPMVGMNDHMRSGGIIVGSMSVPTNVAGAGYVG